MIYNGQCFDLPMLRVSFGLALDQAHIDLRYVLSRLGFKGGLKDARLRLLRKCGRAVWLTTFPLCALQVESRFAAFAP